MTTVPILLGFNGSNYQVTRSLRFRSSASAYLNRTPSAASNRQTWTWSGWIKRGILGASPAIFGAYLTNNTTETGLRFTGDTINFYSYVSSYLINASTAAVFRDPSAWYHIVLAVDTTQATNSNGVKIWVNGVQQTLSFTAYTQNHSTYVNNNNQHYISRDYAGGYQDGYMAEVNFIDGQALTPSSFGYFDLYGVWQPKKYNGTFGTNGFYLPFSNTTSTTTLVADSSGNGNNWTANNISLTAGTTYDSMIDSPTNYADGGTGRGNYAVLNPIVPTGAAVISGGNLNIVSTATYCNGLSTINLDSGAYYCECVVTTHAAEGWGVWDITKTAAVNTGSGTSSGFYGIYSGGATLVTAGIAGTTNAAGTPANGDIIQVAWSNGNVWLGKNNTWYNSTFGTTGNPSTGANPTFTGLTVGQFAFIFGAGNATVSLSANFGQRPFTYTPPTGFQALNTQNLTPSAVPYGAPYMNAITYTGYGPLVPSGLGILTKRNASTQNVSKSLRLRASASAYLNRTNASNGNLNTWTISFWIKRGASITGSNQCVIGTSYTSLSEIVIRFNSDDTFRFEQYASGGTTNLGTLVTSQVFRDPSAWYHFTIIFDSSNATASSRVRLYVNGTQVTAFSSATYPAQNANSIWNNNANTQFIGKYSTAQHFDGYLAEVNFIDGQALTPSSFGQTNSDGIWVPKAYTGTYGTNGFYLPFTNTTSTTTLVADSSGNGNNWTPNNISLTAGTTYDSMIDSPTDYASAGNYVTLNPLDKNTNIALSDGNLTAIPSSTADYWLARATMAFPTTGKYYWELTLNNTPYLYQAGIYSANRPTNGAISATGNEYQVAWGTAFTYIQYQSNNAAFASWGTNTNPTSGNVLMFAYDADNATMWIGRNGTWYNTSGTANPATNTDPRFSSIPTGLFAGVNLPNPASGGVSMNFGQRPFVYAAPTGFTTLNTYNITAPSTTWFSSANNSGNASATAYPDFVWIKSRSSAQNHSLNDTLRGPTLNLITNNVNVEAGASTMFAVNKYGLTLGNDASVNSSSYTDVMWGWQGGNGTTSTNTSGTITSQVSASTTSGFSILTYTGNFTAGATVGHGLGVAPSMILVKTRTQASVDWITYHVSLGPTKGLYMDTGAATTSAIFWNNTSPTASVITLGGGAQSNGNGQNMVAYCWAAIRGFSAFGSYTGNGSTDGPFIYTGFRPRFILTKCSSNSTASTVWTIWDTSRNTYNASVNELYPNSSSAEFVDSSGIDILSNGFKPKRNSEYANFSGWTYVYAAFAENPFNMSRAR